MTEEMGAKIIELVDELSDVNFEIDRLRLKLDKLSERCSELTMRFRDYGLIILNEVRNEK